jgi:sialate O-acetylesterase
MENWWRPDPLFCLKQALDRVFFRAFTPRMKYLYPLLFLVGYLQANLALHPLFSDHAVLQREMAVPVWGTAEPGVAIKVKIADQTVETKADDEGNWQVRLNPMEAGGPYELTVSDGETTLERSDILFGEVWICSGQSNMEWPMVGGTGPVVNGEAELAKAHRPNLRHFSVLRATAFKPQSSIAGEWQVSSPTAAIKFSAVAYFFGRDLLEELDVPIGLIKSAWGGTRAEAWTPAAGVSKFEAFQEELAKVQAEDADEALERFSKQKLNDWYNTFDKGLNGSTWAATKLRKKGWKSINVPGAWEEQGYPGLDGVFWYRKSFELSADELNKELTLKLGVVDYFDTIWLNGELIGGSEGLMHEREYQIPSKLLKEKNVLAVRVLDGGNSGGILGGESTVGIYNEGMYSPLVDLSGEWLGRVSNSLDKTDPVPNGRTNLQHTVTVLYNGMIAPLIPYAMRGVIWYQGESNASRAHQYRELFPTMISEWRKEWKLGDFPFLYVQIAPHKGQIPEIREAQFLTLDRSANTAMAVITDNGNAEDIHPLNKEPVGERLALAARALAYGEDIEYSGPLFSGLKIKGSKAEVHFKHTTGGLVAAGGPLRGFTIAGEDGEFRPATAEIVGDVVHVYADAVSTPVAVRYGWENVPDINLFNAEGLPASPFRSDVTE